MATSPAINDFELLAQKFRELSEDLRHFEATHINELDDKQRDGVNQSYKALHRLFLLFIGEDIEATLDSLKVDVEVLKKVTAETQPIIQEAKTIDKVVKVAVALGGVALGVLDKDPDGVESSLGIAFDALTSAGTQPARPAATKAAGSTISTS